jgi:hypothetical protein
VRLRLTRRAPAWAEQQALLSDDEVTPRMCELVLAITPHYLDTAE